MPAARSMMSTKAGQERITMQPGPQTHDAHDADDLLYPSCWLVYGLPWPDDTDMAEAAIAIPPAAIPRQMLSRDAVQILDCAELYARKRTERVIFFSDLTRMFTVAGTSWAELEISWESALQELKDGPFPMMFLTISGPAYIHICSPAVRLLAGPDGEDRAADAEREHLRQSIATILSTDWPPYIQGRIDAGRLHQTS
jgi:hypothetical protein